MLNCNAKKMNMEFLRKWLMDLRRCLETSLNLPWLLLGMCPATSSECKDVEEFPNSQVGQRIEITLWILDPDDRVDGG